uniref:Reverse transcriptase domain-containing protein n=1 Tax=Tanacetum cinerariifolium TaxID=118510 RepID=A0A6L2M7F0_TANCI|nr:hypothetical protein [Tanacetum cinerariifolium]
MRTRSQSPYNSPQQEASPVIVEPLRIELPFLKDQFQEDPPPEVPMADNRTMAELLQAPTEGYEDAIVQILKRAASLQSKPLPYSDLCEIVFQNISTNGDGQWTNTEIRVFASVSAASASRPSASGASVSRASISGASISRASAIRERVGALNMDDHRLVDVVVHVDDDDDDDDGNSRAHKINDEVRPKKKAKTSRATIDDLMVDMQSALRHIVGTINGPTTEQCYEKLKLGAVDALDGTLIHARVAHDSRILSEAIRNQNAPFPLPPPHDGGVEEDQVVQPQGNVFDREYMTNLRDQIAQQLMQSG